MYGIANDWVTDRSTLSFESGLNVQSGHSEGHLRVIRAVLCELLLTWKKSGNPQGYLAMVSSLTWVTTFLE